MSIRRIFGYVEILTGHGTLIFGSHCRNNINIMGKKYQITSYQLVYASGGRDTVKLFMPVMVDDLEKYRNSIRATHDCIGVNLTYTELP